MHIFLVAMLMSFSAPAATGPSGASVAADPEKKICRKVSETGSRLGRRKVCVTQHEWDEAQRQANDYTRGMQLRNGVSGMPKGN